jgi:anti-anti-sigma regulatory factor
VIEVCHQQGVARTSAIVVVELRRSSTVDLARLFQTASNAGDDVGIVVDLGGLSDLTADLLTLLRRTARHLRGRLAIVSGHRDVRKILDVTLLSQELAVFATRNDAFLSLRSPVSVPDGALTAYARPTTLERRCCG